MRISIILIFATLISCNPASQSTDNELRTIAFGSCSRQWEVESQLWKEVNAEQPDLWIWLGDNIYADTEDMNKMKDDYDLQKSHPDYQTLLSQTSVIGIWDDHDYGANDIGKEYPKKDESKKLLFDFLDVHSDNEAWGRKGAYQSYDYDIGDRKLKIILLDARYFRDTLKWEQNPKSAVINENGEVLGEEQWKWFESELSDSETDMFIVGSGIQVLTEDHRFEKWANFPSERVRLLDLIAQKVNVPLLFISGDRHISEVSKLTLDGYDYPLYDITSSSLTSPWGEESPEVNVLRVGEIVYPANFAVINLDLSGVTTSFQLRYIGKENESLQDLKVDY